MEALAIIFVFVVALIIFGVTWIGTVNGARHVITEQDQLEEYRESLRKKALRAQLERWDDAMMDRLADELADVDQRIARLAKRT